MNELDIEKLLRKAPQPNVPEGLFETLQDDIALRSQVHPRHNVGANWFSLWKRWLPTAAYCLCLVVCAAMVQIQFQTIGKLREEIRQLQESAKNVDQLRAANLEYQKLLAENQQLGRLQKENAEMQSLRTATTALREQLQSSNSVNAENQQLKAEIKNLAPDDEDFFAKEKRKAQSVACINNLKQICLAARMWANDHTGEFFPKDLISMKSEMVTPKVLICPGDKGREGEETDITWDDVKRGAVSYQIVTPGASDTKPNVVYVRCPFHNNIGMVDGSVRGAPWTNHYELDKNNELQPKPVSQ